MLWLLQYLDGESSSGESPVPQIRSIGQFILCRLFSSLTSSLLRSGFTWVTSVVWCLLHLWWMASCTYEWDFRVFSRTLQGNTRKYLNYEIASSFKILSCSLFAFDYNSTLHVLHTILEVPWENSEKETNGALRKKKLLSHDVHYVQATCRRFTISCYGNTKLLNFKALTSPLHQLVRT
jgi:hypothetical protein